jgi:hypothetical protein
VPFATADGAAPVVETGGGRLAKRRTGRFWL